MKIQKKTMIQTINKIHYHHLKCCGLEQKVKKKEEPKVLNGDLILYDKKGNIIVHSDENSK